MKNYFLPTKENNYTPKLLTHKFITIYTFLLLVFNIATSNAKIFAAFADVDAASILEYHNQERLQNGLNTLTLNSKLTASAKAKAKAMMAADCWDHYCPAGKSPWDFIEDAGYQYVYAGENLAEGFSDNKKVFDAWMNSKTHRENILRPDFEEIGIAIEYGEFQGISNNALIVVHFGSTSLDTNQSNPSDVPVSDSQGFSTIITSPKDGAILNTNTPVIEGQSEDGIVRVYNDNEYISNTTADEGIFTYRFKQDNALIDGKHSIKAEHSENLTHDQIEIQIDTISPEISSLNYDSVLKRDKQNFVVVSLSGSQDITQITTNFEEVEISKLSETEWTLTIEYEEFRSENEIELTVFDEAGNSTTKTANLTSIKGIANNQVLEFSDPSSRLIFGIDKVGLRRSINLVFILFILALITVDYFALTKISLDNNIPKKRMGHHFSIFAMLLLITLAGGTTGELLNGINS
ncbi:hypothetical protein JW978_00105 [Candidatus Dojkabacteria bacterium]|nr:hypothetical protein [Candidatus Dojkabacteria bacterium]